MGRLQRYKTVIRSVFCFDYSYLESEGTIPANHESLKPAGCCWRCHPASFPPGCEKSFRFVRPPQVTSCTSTPATPRPSKRSPSWCLPWRRCRCPAASVSSTSAARTEGTCSPSSPGTDWASTRSCGGRGRRTGSTLAALQGSGYLCRWTWRRRTRCRSGNDHRFEFIWWQKATLDPLLDYIFIPTICLPLIQDQGLRITDLRPTSPPLVTHFSSFLGVQSHSYTRK